MANQPKVRTSRTLSGGKKTVTRSKYTDAAGTKIRTREVNKNVVSPTGAITGVSKTTTKRKFANGSTSKQKTQSVEREGAGVNKITSVKEKVSKKGILGKAKGLLSAANKYGYTGELSSAKSLNYRSAKGMQKAVKKGYQKK